MNQQILKYQFPIKLGIHRVYVPSYFMPMGEVQVHQNQFTFWGLGDTSMHKTHRDMMVMYTGDEMDLREHNYINAIIDGAIVYHILEKRK